MLNSDWFVAIIKIKIITWDYHNSEKLLLSIYSYFRYWLGAGNIVINFTDVVLE